MDRGTKMMFGAMTVAISLMVINMFGNNAPQAYAATLGAQGGSEPTIVWYGAASSPYGPDHIVLFRAWSDGTVEAKALILRVEIGNIGSDNECNLENLCAGSPNGDPITPWITINDPNEGMAAAADIIPDASVNMLDLIAVLDNWGSAPPNMIPPSDCPLAMINP